VTPSTAMTLNTIFIMTSKFISLALQSWLQTHLSCCLTFHLDD
jgi:hypothetical protein